MKKEKAQIILFVACLILTTILTTASDAQNHGDATYYCTAEAAGGLSYNKVEKKWKGTGFNTTNKFVLRLKFLREFQSQNDIPGFSGGVYKVTVTEAGKNVGQSCVPMESASDEVQVRESLRISCTPEWNADEIYEFNLKNNRYFHMSIFGYLYVGEGKFIGSGKDLKKVPDNDEDSDTPFIEGGKCTKIE